MEPQNYRGLHRISVETAKPPLRSIRPGGHRVGLGTRQEHTVQYHMWKQRSGDWGEAA